MREKKHEKEAKWPKCCETEVEWTGFIGRQAHVDRVCEITVFLLLKLQDAWHFI